MNDGSFNTLKCRPPGFYARDMTTAQTLTKHISEAIAELRLRLTSTKEGARKLRGPGSDSASQKLGESGSSPSLDRNCGITLLEDSLNRTMCFGLVALHRSTEVQHVPVRGEFMASLVSTAHESFSRQYWKRCIRGSGGSSRGCTLNAYQYGVLSTVERHWMGDQQRHRLSAFVLGKPRS